jgi:hypothetical protein
MREDPLDQHRLLDAREDVQGRTNAAGAWMRGRGDRHRLAAARSASHIDAKDPLQPLGLYALWVQLIAACRPSAERSRCAVPPPAFRPLPEGVTSARQR